MAVRPSRKRCSRCKTEKPLEEIVRNRSTPDGYGSYCKPCAVLNQQESKVRRGWKPYVKITREEELRRKRERRHVSAYGITVADRERMLEEQGNVCAICGGPPTGNRWDTFVIDHDHISGKVRGLLCSNCNVAIGLLNDDPKLIERAMEYLLRAKEKKV